MKSHFRKFGNQMSGSGNHLCKFTLALIYPSHIFSFKIRYQLDYFFSPVNSAHFVIAKINDVLHLLHFLPIILIILINILIKGALCSLNLHALIHIFVTAFLIVSDPYLLRISSIEVLPLLLACSSGSCQYHIFFFEAH